jgi:hypothetical protein
MEPPKPRTSGNCQGSIDEAGPVRRENLEESGNNDDRVAGEIDTSSTGNIVKSEEGRTAEIANCHKTIDGP